MKRGISIVICCYNSAAVIRDTLQSLAQLEKDGFGLEIILVDNNCSDNTINVVEDSWKSFEAPFDLRIVTETKPGLNFARKKGVFESVYEYMIFCDDDNRLDSQYAAIVFSEFEKDPKVGVLGGWSEGIYEIEKPFWFESVQTSYAIGGYTDNDVENPEYLWGAGMSLRTELARRIFAETFRTTDRSGNSLTAGGDLEICDLARAFEYNVKKKNNLKFYHYITRKRLSWHYCIKLYEGFGYSNIKYQKNSAFKKWKVRLAMIKIFAFFMIKNPALLAGDFKKKEGQLKILQYSSLLGALKSSFSA